VAWIYRQITDATAKGLLLMKGVKSCSRLYQWKSKVIQITSKSTLLVVKKKLQE